MELLLIAAAAYALSRRRPEAAPIAQDGDGPTTPPTPPPRRPPTSPRRPPLPAVKVTAPNIRDVFDGLAPKRPRLNLPGARLPKINVPGVTVPNFDGLAPKRPRLNLPGARLPKINVPGISLPKIEMPGVTLPPAGFLTVPLPSLNLPSVDLPEYIFDTPVIDLPELPAVLDLASDISAALPLARMSIMLMNGEDPYQGIAQLFGGMSVQEKRAAALEAKNVARLAHFEDQAAAIFEYVQANGVVSLSMMEILAGQGAGQFLALLRDSPIEDMIKRPATVRQLEMWRKLDRIGKYMPASNAWKNRLDYAFFTFVNGPPDFKQIQFIADNPDKDPAIWDTWTTPAPAEFQTGADLLTGSEAAILAFLDAGLVPTT
jgi:hypothetical protein